MARDISLFPEHQWSAPFCLWNTMVISDATLVKKAEEEMNRASEGENGIF